jgi:heptosyltransferase III
MIALPARARILVIALRRLGDVLLTTPLIRSLKRAFPDAAIEALVFAGTEGILAGNPDLSGVITMREGATVELARSLWRRYDLALSTQSGDRPILFAWMAGRVSAGLVKQRGAGGVMARVKRAALGLSVAADDERHRVEEVLELAVALGVPRVPELVCPSAPLPRERLPAGAYAVVHVGPMFSYKRWQPQGWRALAAALAARGLSVVATGGPSPEDRRYGDEVWGEGAPDGLRRLDGVLSWGELAATIAGAAVYVGPDTSVTHLAAATGAMTVALYGPTDPRRFGPWPVGADKAPWVAAGTIQHDRNVWLVQNPLPCLPCHKEGCERRIDSYSRCLDELSADQVLTAVDQALALAGRPG